MTDSLRTVLAGLASITILLFIWCSTLAQSQSGSATDVSMVILNVRVTDGKRHTVIDVSRDAFR